MANIPEYMRVRQYVVDLLMSHPNIDERIMSERELCSKLDVARITARRALKGLIDDGWLYVKPGKGMFIHSGRNRNTATSKRKFYKIMIILGDGKNVHIDGFGMYFMEELCASLRQLPVLLQTANLIGENGQTVDELSMYRPDGIIWLRPPRTMVPAIAAMRQKVPVCVVGNPVCGDEFAVTMDYNAAGRLAAAWFLDRNFHRTAFAGHSPGSEVISSVMAGWLAEYAERGITLDPSLIIRDEEDIDVRTGALLKSGLDGIFAFAYEFLALDSAIIKHGKTCPVVIDENYCGYYGAKTRPDAKLLLFPPEIVTTAAGAMFKLLSGSDSTSGEMVFKPEIKEVSLKS